MEPNIINLIVSIIVARKTLLIKKPEILILDEATAALDLSTQTKILNNLKNMKPDLTIIMITHSNEVLKMEIKRKPMTHIRKI